MTRALALSLYADALRIQAQAAALAARIAPLIEELPILSPTGPVAALAGAEEARAGTSPPDAAGHRSAAPPDAEQPAASPISVPGEAAAAEIQNPEPAMGTHAAPAAGHPGAPTDGGPEMRICRRSAGDPGAPDARASSGRGTADGDAAPKPIDPQPTPSTKSPAGEKSPGSGGALARTQDGAAGGDTSGEKRDAPVSTTAPARTEGSEPGSEPGRGHQELPAPVRASAGGAALPPTRLEAREGRTGVSSRNSAGVALKAAPAFLSGDRPSPKTGKPFRQALTPKQTAVLDYISGVADRGGTTPALEHLGRLIKASKVTAHYVLDALETRGLIRVHGTARDRSFEIVATGNRTRPPSGAIARTADNAKNPAGRPDNENRIAPAAPTTTFSATLPDWLIDAMVWWRNTDRKAIPIAGGKVFDGARRLTRAEFMARVNEERAREKLEPIQFEEAA